MCAIYFEFLCNFHKRFLIENIFVLVFFNLLLQSQSYNQSISLQYNRNLYNINQ